MSGTSSSDGRVRRGVRNRERIVEAVIALVRGGNPRPSAEAIAAAAGIGTRTVFRQFSDMEGLFVEVQARLQQEMMPLFDTSPIEGTLPQRVRDLVARRARVYERLSPFRLSGLPHRRDSPAIRRGSRALDGWNREQLRAAFAPELRGAPVDLLEVLDALTSFEAWDRLRHAQRLSRTRAGVVVTRTVLALLAARG